MARHEKWQAMFEFMAPRRHILALIIAILAFSAFSTDASATKRVALVIGNSAYEHANQLANPANDASDMGAALNELGFEVVVGTDLNNRAMRQKVREFSRILRGADVAMMFYAGHAMQVDGKNFLAPVDAKLEFESDLDFETIPLSFIQRQMEREANTILLFLDACRDNPLTRSFRAASRSNGAGRGLAEEKLSSSGILIAFATNPGNIALDGKGRNSPFTKAMLDNIRRPGVEISTLMTDVRVQVVKDTDGQQTPWINSALLGRFYFNPDESVEEEQLASTSQTDATENAADDKIDSGRSGSSAGVENARIAALAWDAVKDSDSVEELESFLQSYGSSFYAKLAKIRIDRLKSGQPKQEVASGQENATPEQKETTEAQATEAQAKAGETEVASLEQPKPDESRTLEKKVDPRELALGIQKELARLDCNPGRPDGIWGKRSQRALDSFAKASKIRLAATSPAPELLDQLRDHNGAGCPKRVIAKTCPAGQRLSRKGNCFTPRTQTASTPPRTTTRSISQPPQEEVFIQDGRQIVIQEPQNQQVIIHQQEPVFVPQQQPVIVQQPQPVMQPRPSLGQRIIGGALSCIVSGC